MGVLWAGCAEALFGYEMFRSTTSGLHVVAVAGHFLAGGGGGHTGGVPAASCASSAGLR